MLCSCVESPALSMLLVFFPLPIVFWTISMVVHPLAMCLTKSSRFLRFSTSAFWMRPWQIFKITVQIRLPCHFSIHPRRRPRPRARIFQNQRPGQEHKDAQCTSYTLCQFSIDTKSLQQSVHLHTIPLPNMAHVQSQPCRLPSHPRILHHLARSVHPCRASHDVVKRSEQSIV